MTYHSPSFRCHHSHRWWYLYWRFSRDYQRCYRRHRKKRVRRLLDCARSWGCYPYSSSHAPAMRYTSSSREVSRNDTDDSEMTYSLEWSQGNRTYSYGNWKSGDAIRFYIRGLSRTVHSSLILCIPSVIMILGIVKSLPHEIFSKHMALLRFFHDEFLI